MLCLMYYWWLTDIFCVVLCCDMPCHAPRRCARLWYAMLCCFSGDVLCQGMLGYDMMFHSMSCYVVLRLCSAMSGCVMLCCITCVHSYMMSIIPYSALCCSCRSLCNIQYAPGAGRAAFVKGCRFTL